MWTSHIICSITRLAISFLPHHPTAPCFCVCVFPFPRCVFLPHPNLSSPIHSFTRFLSSFLLFVTWAAWTGIDSLWSHLQSMRALVYALSLSLSLHPACMHADIGLVPEPTGQVPEAGAIEHSEGIIGSQFKRRIQWTLAHWIPPVTGRQRIQRPDMREGGREVPCCTSCASQHEERAAVINCKIKFPDSDDEILTNTHTHVHRNETLTH